MTSADRFITVFGSINADMIFELDQLPAPGQTLLARQFRVEAGGKGANQAVAAAQDGARVAIVGAVGTDALAQSALAGLKASGVDLSRLALTGQPTGCAGINTDSRGRNQIVVALGANAALRGAQLDAALLARSSHVLLQMETPVAEVEAVIMRARAAGIYSILNLAPAIPLPLEALRACGMIVVNEDEAVALAGWLNCGASAAQLHRALGVDIVRTLGGDGAEGCTTDGGVRRVAARPIKPVDTTAAGDCFIGVLAAELARGVRLAGAMERASSAAAICCTRRGSQSSLPRQAETGAAHARWLDGQQGNF